jgi:hypothetical protein
LAKWRKKEGDKVVAGDVVAEIETVRSWFTLSPPARVEKCVCVQPRSHVLCVFVCHATCFRQQDKATMEMESMEDGYVAKLLKPEGAQNITVGEVRPHRIAAGVRQLCGNC